MQRWWIVTETQASADLTLTETAVHDLFRRGSPIYESGRSGIQGCRGVVVPASRGEYLVIRWEQEARGMETTITGGAALDMQDPTGRFHALLWLRERGHDLRWAQDEAEVLAWSVLSVARGGGPLQGVMHQWRHSDKYGGQWTRMGGPGSVYAEVREYGRREEGWERGWYLWGVSGGPRGPETNTLGRAAADRAALAAGYALRNGNNVLVLPPLPEVPRG